MKNGAGSRNTLLDLCDPNDIQADDGQPVPSHKPRIVFPDVWAEVKSVGGGERIWGLQVEASVDTAVRVLYREGVKPTMYFRPKGTTRQLQVVRAADPDGRRKDLVCMCKEVPQ